ncbi:MAG: hypothetical protein M0P12_13970 [Paludibacteraceae bacterium]|nr:hypothetical protein [Paludibacteraceae bacterium]
MVKVKVSELKDGQKIRYVSGKGILKEGNQSRECGEIRSPVHVVGIIDGIVCGVSKTWKNVVVLSECQSVYRM